MNRKLKRFGILNKDNSFSITNFTVYVFLCITAFKLMFSGADLSFKVIKWKIESLDISSTLPLLFSLLNYSHKRMIVSKGKDEEQVS